MVDELERRRQGVATIERARAEGEKRIKAAEAEQRQREAAEERTREEAQRARAEAADALVVAELRRTFLAANPAAGEADFRRELPRLRAARTDRLIATGMDADSVARRNHAAMYSG
jgi:hypothetical protein